RSPGNNPTVYQQGTYAPDSNYRWMGSAAMDKSGDIAVGYSASSGSIVPAIRYAGRVSTDPLGILEAETSIIEGTGAQTGGLNRWGDYTSMSVDPVDDCTFWYTNEYLATSGSFNWQTRIASFKFPSCGSAPAPDFSLSPSPASQTVVQGNTTSYTVNVGALNGFSGTVSFSASGLGSGASASFSPVTVPGSGSTTMTVTTTLGAELGSFTLTITATSGSLTHATNVTLVVNAPVVPDFSVSVAPSSLSVKRGSSGGYSVTVKALNGFTGTVALSVSGLPRHATGSFAPASIAGWGASTLTVSAGKPTSTGTYTVTISATSGSLAHSATATLTVQ
ncbi:MAG TPA: hypothetical protein VKU44_02165, partial [Terriglobia bacterium]|nr:hypothetical protein [Terriglobia bacterium]